MNHWTEYLTFAVCHQYAMQFTQIALDPMQIAAALQEAQRQASQFQQLAGNRFDPRMIISPR